MHFNKYITIDKPISHRVLYCVCGLYQKKKQKMIMNLT